jgi:hypothetical protein
MYSAAAAAPLPSERSPIELSRRVARRGRLMLGRLEDAGLLLLLALAFPLVILIMGAPVVLVVRLLIEIARRW